MTERSFQILISPKKELTLSLALILTKLMPTNMLDYVMIFMFTLSHGQYQVERGLIINNDIMVVNMYNDSLITQRIVYDHMKCNIFSHTTMRLGRNYVPQYYQLIQSTN